MIIYYFYSSELDYDELTEDTWDSFNYFIPLGKVDFSGISVKGILMNYQEDQFYKIEISSPMIKKIPFLTEEMKHFFIDGIFRAKL